MKMRQDHIEEESYAKQNTMEEETNLILNPELESEDLKKSKGTLEKISEELNAIKSMKSEIRELQHFRNEQTNKTSINSHQYNTEIFCDSFFKYQ